MYLMATYTKYKMVTTKFYILRHVIFEVCKIIDNSNRPFLACMVANTIYTPK